MGLKTNIEDWGHVFNAAEAIFTKDLAKAKSDNQSGYAEFSKLLDPARKETGPIVASLSGLLKLVGGSDTIGTSNCPPKVLKAMTEEFKKLGGAVKKYTASVDTATNGKIPAIKSTVKDKYPESYRQLKLLKTEIIAIQAKTATMLKGVAVAKDNAKIDAKAKKPIEKAQAAMDNAKTKELKNVANQRKDLLTLATRYRAAIAKGAASIQKIKAKPDVDTYNTEFYKAGRDLSQVVVNIQKMKSTDMIKDLKEVKGLPDPGQLGPAIAEFGNQGGKYYKLAPTATPRDVLQALSLYSGLLKQMSTVYQPLMAMK